LPSRLCEEERFKGKRGQMLAFHTHGRIGASRILLVGAGQRKDFSPASLCPLVGRAARQAQSTSARSLALLLLEMDRPAQERAVELATLGIELGRYRFDKYLSEDRRQPETLAEATFLVEKNGSRIDGLRRMVERGKVMAQAVARTRDLVNEP